MKQDDITTYRELLNEAADELAWLHRSYLYKSTLSEGVPRIVRLLQKIERRTGHATASPYPPDGPPNISVGLFDTERR
jgi:hypothetical protein